MSRLVLTLLIFCLSLVASNHLLAQSSRAAIVDNDIHKTKDKLALVIGNSDYTGQAHLRNPNNDADSMAKVLRELGFDVIQKKNLSKREFDMEIEDFGNKLKDYRTGMFYYSGHGAEANGENYLFPVDANPKGESEVKYTLVSVGLVLAVMEDAQTNCNIMILDACRSNPFKRSWSRGGSEGLAGMSAPKGTFIGFAASPGSTASDGMGVNGVYTQAILNNIRNAGISLTDLFTDVNNDVRQLTNESQVPFQVNSMNKRFYFITHTAVSAEQVKDWLVIGDDYRVGRKGKGVDFMQALYYYQKAADQGNEDAEIRIGFIYENGQGVDKDYKKALEYYQQAAGQGNAIAQYNLGIMYYNGEGVDKDYKKAVEYYQKAADQGYANAEFRIGLMYEKGEGVETDLRMALTYYQKAGDQGNPWGLYHLGYLYKRGVGVDKDYKKAVVYFEKAADQGIVAAQSALGYMYAKGEGVDLDFKKAAFFFQRAADQGNADAQSCLGMMYENGIGVEQNLSKAKEYYKLAAAQGDEDAKKRLAELNK